MLCCGVCTREHKVVNTESLKRKVKKSALRGVPKRSPDNTFGFKGYDKLLLEILNVNVLLHVVMHRSAFFRNDISNNFEVSAETSSYVIDYLIFAGDRSGIVTKNSLL